MNKDRAKDSFIAHIAIGKKLAMQYLKLKTKMTKLRSSDYASIRNDLMDLIIYPQCYLCGKIS